MSFNFSATGAGLGATSTPAKPGFGTFSFGGSAPAFGTNTAAQTTSALGSTPAFGSTGFGAPATSLSFGTNTTSSLGGFGGFGATTTSTPSAFGGFGAAAPSTGGFGLGQTTNTGFSGFGTGGTAGFGGFGAPTTSTSLFGGFGTSTTSAGGFGGFGTNFGSTSLFGTQQQQQQLQQQQQQLNQDDAFAQSIFNVSIYNDERDTVIAKWNYLQAMWGSGKLFYSQNAEPLDVTPQNYLCRFKTMGYGALPGKDNKAGLVSITFSKPLSEIKDQQQNLTQRLSQIFGSKPNLAIFYESIKSLPDGKTRAMIYVEEKSQQNSNETRRILATEVSNFLNQDSIKSQLATMGVVQVVPYVLPDEEQLKQYLDNPPKGIDPRMWHQAKLDNPDPVKLIPVPMIGFNELKNRIKCQENETDMHVHYLAKVEKDLAELKQRHVLTTAKIMEHKRKLAELSHRILQIIVKQESTRKVGVALSPEEEILRSKLENMQAVVSAPTQFKGRLSELLSQMRMQRNNWVMSTSNGYSLDKDAEEEMKAFLSMQQKAIKNLIDTINKDVKALNIISDGMVQLTRG